MANFGSFFFRANCGGALVGWDGMGWWAKVSFISSYFLRILIINISTYIGNKNCHQHSYGILNLMSSWGVGILFSKFIWENVFLKNHAKSVGFHVVIWSQNLRFSYFLFERDFFCKIHPPLIFVSKIESFRYFVQRDFFCKFDPHSLFWQKFWAFQKFRLNGFLL